MSPRTPAVTLILALLAATASAQEATSSAADHPTQQLPYTPSLDVASMDRSVDPCEDLYTYACGRWQKSNPIPADQASWSVYSKLYVDNQRFLWGVLETAANPTTQRTADQQKIGDYFAACMDEAAIDKRGLGPLQPDLDRITAVTSVHELPTLLGDLHTRIAGDGMLFAISVEQDAHDAMQVIVGLDAGGLGLPDRDYYLKSDTHSKETRAHYQSHVSKMLALAGATPKRAAAGAATILRIETTLAKASLTVVDKRDPYKLYHRAARVDLGKTAPDFDWTKYFKAGGVEPGAWLNVSEPAFFNAVDQLMKKEPLENLKLYLRWSVLDAQAANLSKAFKDENFAFYSAYLRGVKQQKPRWRECVARVDRDLGDALGQEFVQRTFPAAIKAQTVRMTEQIEAAMRQRIEQLPWMSQATKTQALAKLDKMRNKVGYPDLWRDYSSLEIRRDDFYGNVTRATIFETHRELAKIGKPVDRSEWQMTPVTVNAEYNPQLNDLNFPAAVLLPPLYDANMDDAPNYGNTGGTIGHELTHGFDDEGRQYDGDGNLRDWWKKGDADQFEKGARCVRDQYAQYTVVDDIRINSALTAGEDIADFGGLILAWSAWQEQTKAMSLVERDGLTPAQRFFVGYAQWDCSNERPENLRLHAMTDPHSPSKYRINGVVANMPEFAKAFKCKAGQALVKAEKDICRIW